ncbi:CAP domain-containing protein [Nakamurella antarctica]|nr:CAP domain-containing protein [Nakamurella antarctica]
MLQTLTAGRVSPVATGGRAKANRLLACLVLVCAMLVPAVASAPMALAAGPQLTAFDQELISMINVKRSAAGLPQVQEATGLTNLSVWWSSQMADGATGNQLQHNPNAFQQVTSYGASNRTSWGENVAKWSPASVTAQSIFDSYWASPGHKANILGASFRFVGMGSVTGSNGASWNTMTFTDQVEPGQVVAPPAPVPNGNPVGVVDVVQKSGSTVYVQGWGWDPDALSSSAAVHIYDFLPSGGSVGYQTVANIPRADVWAAYPASGPNRGYGLTIPISGTGKHNICAYVINQGPGGNVQVGCRAVEVGQPFGSFDTAVISPGSVSVSGWSIDPGAPTTSTQVHVYDTGPTGTVGYQLQASQSRSDVGAVYPGTGSNHGFRQALSITAEGNHNLCAYVISASAGSNQSLGCKTIVIRYLTGVVDSARAAGSQISVQGWVFDALNPSATVEIHAYVSGPAGVIGYPGNYANGPRGDVGAAYGTGNNHGFGFSIPSSGRGANTVCLYAISTQAASGNKELGCQQVVVN